MIKYLILFLLTLLAGLLFYGCSNDNITEPDFYSNQKITMKIPASQDSMMISLGVYDNCSVEVAILKTSGERARLLVDQFMDAGLYLIKWDMKDDDGNRITKGIYCIAMTIRHNHNHTWLEIY